MCTLVMLRRPDHDWPLIIGANRDEMLDRAWQKPGRHWPDRADVTAGLDEVAGGSWMGVNDHGVFAAILNRVGSLGPQDGKRSRGELVLDALDYADARDSAEFLAALNPDAYRPFNLVIGDNRDVFWLAHRGAGEITIEPVPIGLSMLTARELDDPTSPRIARYRDRFRAAPAPEPERDDWWAWQVLLGESQPQKDLGPESAMRFLLPNGFGTVSSSVLALPSVRLGRVPEWRFARAADLPAGWDAIPVA